MTHPNRPCMARMIAAAALTAASLATMSDASAQRAFATPDQAAEALASAWQSGSSDSLLAIFGPDGAKLVSSGDPVAERYARDRLAAAYAEQHHIEPANDGRTQIVLGKDDWPYPIPLVKQEEGWVFDVKDGAQQIVDRRVGRNELDAIESCRTFVQAQDDYASRDPMGTGLHEYAQKIASSEGKRDGLYWPVSEGEQESPLGPLVAAAEAQGYGRTSAEGLTPFHGYYFRILTRQGRHADGGPKDYLVNGHLTRGFALLAYPAKYGDSGVMTFIVSKAGIVFEKNLGPDTATIAAKITEYDPDRSWRVVRQQ